MRIWAEVYLANGAMVGMVNGISAGVTRRLDGAGEIELAVPVTDPAAVNHLGVGRIVHLYTDTPAKRLIGRGILLRQTLKIAAEGEQVQWRGMDLLEELRRTNTLRGLIFNNVPIEQAVRTLVGCAAGWSVLIQGVSGNTSLRFDGVSILKALNSLREKHGYHFRLGPGERQITFGTLGATSGLRVTNVRRADRGLLNNADVALIDRLELVRDGFEVVNWIEPIAGNHDAALTLKYANKTSPYLPQTENDRTGRAIYILRDDASIAQYGQIQAVLLADDLVPVEPTSAGRLNTANVLYDYAAAYLQRHAQAQTAYKISAVKARPVQVGEKIRLVYRGEVTQNAVRVRYADVDTDLWVLKSTERYTVNGQATEWEVATVDIAPSDPAEVIAGVVEGQKSRQIGVPLRVDRREISTTPTVNKSTPGTISFEARSTTVDVAACKLTVTRQNSSGPGTISITVDGVAYPFGPYLWGADAVNTFSVELGDYFALAALEGTHVIEAACLTGSGPLTLKVELTEVIAGVR